MYVACNLRSCDHPDASSHANYAHSWLAAVERDQAPGPLTAPVPKPFLVAIVDRTTHGRRPNDSHVGSTA
jgi:hypothetical protein